MIVLFYILLLSFFTYFLWWCMGAPDYKNGIVVAAPGRIFSAYGIYIVQKYNDFEMDESVRVATKIAPEISDMRDELKQEIGEMINAGYTTEKCDEYEKNENVFIENRKRELMMRKKLNWWKVAGVCFRCFSLWFSFATMVVLFLASLQIEVIPITASNIIISFFALPISPIVGSALIKLFKDV